MGYTQPTVNRDSFRRDTRFARTVALQPGVNIVRIGPPFVKQGGFHDSAGSLSKKWVLHWGFVDERGNQRPLVCPRKSKNDYCPICQHAYDLLNQVTELARNYRTKEGFDFESMPTDLRTKVTPLYTAYKSIKNQVGFYYPAFSPKEMRTAGKNSSAIPPNTPFILRLSTTASGVLDKKIDALLGDEKTPPADVIESWSLERGVYFSITRVEKPGGFSNDEVDYLYTGSGLQRQIVAGPAPEEIGNYDLYAQKAPDVFNLYSNDEYTAEELEVFLKNGADFSFLPDRRQPRTTTNSTVTAPSAATLAALRSAAPVEEDVSDEDTSYTPVAPAAPAAVTPAVVPSQALEAPSLPAPSVAVAPAQAPVSVPSVNVPASAAGRPVSTGAPGVAGDNKRDAVYAAIFGGKGK